MGIHRRFEGGGGEHGPIIPLPPKGGREEESCDGASQLRLDFIITPFGLSFGGVLLDKLILDNIASGYPITAYTYGTWKGEMFPGDKRVEPAIIQELSEVSRTPSVLPKPGINEDTERPRTTGTDKNEDWKKNPRTTVAEPPFELEKREEYEVKKVEKNPDGPNKIKISIKAQNKKQKLLEKKINKKAGPDAGTPKVKDLVESIAQDCGLTQTYIDDINVAMPEMDIKEYYASEVLQVCSALANAAFTIVGDSLHFFTSVSRPHPVPATTDPIGLANTEGVSGQKVTTNAIRKGTAKVTEDATNITNVVQLANPGEPADRTEKIPGNGEHNEFHLSYQPKQIVAITMYQDGVATSPAFIQQDWGDRALTQHFVASPLSPYPSPDYDGATDPSSDFGIKVNGIEKVIRIVDSVTGADYIMPDGTLNPDWFLLIVYTYLCPTFRVLVDDESVDEWGKRETIVVSPEAQYDLLMKGLGEALLRDKSQPLLNIECEVYDDIYQVGDLVRFVLPELGVDTQLCIFEITRDFDADVRRHHPQRDFGQSVRVRAGSKLPWNLRHILALLNNKLNAINRFWNLADLEVDSGLAVPRQWVRVYREDVKVKEGVTFTLRSQRINRARINRGRIA